MSAAPKSPGLFVVPEPASSPRQIDAAARLEDMVAKRMARKPRAPRSSKDAGERARAGMERMRESGDWSEATGAHLVALYEWMHTEVYGVSPAELDGRGRWLAEQAAGRIVVAQFEGDYGRAALFVRWTWKREQAREQWRRENGRSGQRVGWKLQFSGSLITDYKVDCARVGSGPGR